MPESGSEKAVKKTRAYGVLLAALVAIGSLVLVAISSEPKSAASSPAPAKATIDAPMAGAKSQSEVLLRGKSFAVFKRQLTMPFSGEVIKVAVTEGDMCEKGQVLAEYRIGRPDMVEVHQTLYPAQVKVLQAAIEDLEIQLRNLRDNEMAVKKLQLEQARDQLRDLKELADREMAGRDAVTTKQREIEGIEKEIGLVEGTIQRVQTELAQKRKDLKHQEKSHKQAVELLEWKAERDYNGSGIPEDKAFLKAPIDGQVFWVAPDFNEGSRVPKNTHVMTLAPMRAIVVRSKVHELDLVKIKPGDRGIVTFDALPEKQFACKVTRIPWVSRNQALEVPADYEIECLLEKPDGSIKEGLTCNIKVKVAR